MTRDAQGRICGPCKACMAERDQLAAKVGELERRFSELQSCSDPFGCGKCLKCLAEFNRAEYEGRVDERAKVEKLSCTVQAAINILERWRDDPTPAYDLVNSALVILNEVKP